MCLWDLTFCLIQTNRTGKQNRRKSEEQPKTVRNSPEPPRRSQSNAEQPRTTQNSSEPSTTTQNRLEQLRTAQSSPEQTRAIQNNPEQPELPRTTQNDRKAKRLEGNLDRKFVMLGVALQPDLLLDPNSVQTTKTMYIYIYMYNHTSF